MLIRQSWQADYCVGGLASIAENTRFNARCREGPARSRRTQQHDPRAEQGGGAVCQNTFAICRDVVHSQFLYLVSCTSTLSVRQFHVD